VDGIGMVHSLTATSSRTATKVYRVMPMVLQEGDRPDRRMSGTPMHQALAADLRVKRHPRPTVTVE
jgi:hypothetical protein